MKKTMNKFVCTFINCNRILNKEGNKPFKCTSCGQGTMKPVKQKVHCKECGEAVYDNIDLCPDEKSKEGYYLICGRCTIEMTEYIAEKERRLHTKFIDTEDMKEKEAYCDARILEAEEQNLPITKVKVKSLGDRLRTIRKKLGWNQEQLAEQINLTRRSIINYEKSSRQMPEDIKEWVKTAESTLKHIGREKGKTIIMEKFNEANATP